MLGHKDFPVSCRLPGLLNLGDLPSARRPTVQDREVMGRDGKERGPWAVLALHSSSSAGNRKDWTLELGQKAKKAIIAETS